MTQCKRFIIPTKQIENLDQSYWNSHIDNVGTDKTNQIQQTLKGSLTIIIHSRKHFLSWYFLGMLMQANTFAHPYII